MPIMSMAITRQLRGGISPPRNKFETEVRHWYNRTNDECAERPADITHVDDKRASDRS